MKRILSLLIVLSMIFSLSACGSGKGTDIVDTADGYKVEDANGSKEVVDVDKGLFDVTLTIPVEFVDKEKTQLDYDSTVEKEGYKSITMNEDGSLTYVMTKVQHKDLMNKTTEGFQSDLDKMAGSEDYPNIVSIKPNEDFTKFEIVTKNEELDISESFSVLLFYMMSGMYNILNDTEVNNCEVVFINEASGEIISTGNSSDTME